VPGPGFAGADRRRFLQAVNSFPPAGKKIVDIIGGAVSVRVLADTAPICGRQTSCAGFDPGNGYFMMLNRAQLHKGEFGRFRRVAFSWKCDRFPFWARGSATD
jgi:hypothetical protein